MTSPEFFAALMHRLRDYDEGVLLTYLVAQGATEVPVRSSVTKLGDNQLGGLMSRDRVHRASARLVKRGLLCTRVHPKTWTEYTVPTKALVELLAEPLPDVESIPGVSDRPIPFLVRLQAESIVDAAKAGASLPPSSENVK
ncbi:MAG: hypothetical protein JF606_18425 [Burkholderiales bacterium]|nr:hypothetical protein [Burkholderiales bacterium]